MQIFGYDIQYLIVPAILVFYGVKLLLGAKKKVTKGIDFAKSVNNMRKTFVLNENSSVSNEQFKKLLFGASIFAFDSDYLNDLKSNRSKTTLKDLLNEWWDIDDEISYVGAIENLFESGHRVYYNNALKIATQHQEDDWGNEIAKLPDSKQVDYYEYCENIVASLAMIKEKEVYNAGMENINILSWDMGRVIYLARLAYSVGYITEQQAWADIDSAVSEMKKTYTNWEETARGFMLGRNMWNGDYGQQIVTVNTYESLINEPDSPFKQLSF